MRNTTLAGVLSAGCAAFLVAQASGETVSIVADKDNTLFEMAGLPDLSSGRGDLFAGGIAQQNEFGNAYRRRALIHFPLTAIPAGATINSVSLSMRMTKTIGGTYTFNLYRMLADWGEDASNSGTLGTGVPAQPGDVTWNYRFFGDPSSAWATPGGDFVPTPSASRDVGQPASYTWAGAGMQADVQGWLDGTRPNNGWMLTSELEFLTSIAKRFASRESGTASFRPTIVVNYTVPAPGAVAMGAGAGLMALRRRRRAT